MNNIYAFSIDIQCGGHQHLCISTNQIEAMQTAEFGDTVVSDAARFLVVVGQHRKLKTGEDCEEVAL